jgi:hypothetical protein
MANFWKIYTHELRKIWARYLIVFIAFFALNGIIFGLYKKTESDLVGFLFSVMLVIFYASIPVLFAMSFKSKSDYLPFSLPMCRSSILLARYGAALTILAVALLVSTLWAIAVMVPIVRYSEEQTLIRAGHTDLSQLTHYHHDFLGFLQYESAYFFRVKALFFISFVILGIIALTRSLKYVLRWLNEFLCDLTALILFIAFCWVGLRHLKPMEVGLESIINSMIAGLLFFALGLFLFEKYGEV